MLLASLFLATSAPSAASQPVYETRVSAPVRALVREAQAGQSDDLIPRLEHLVDLGDSSATELLGEIFSFGLFGIERNRARGCGFFARIADTDALAAHNYGTCLYENGSARQDYVKARHYYTLASDGGYPTAHCALGNMMIRGEGGPSDTAKGLALCRRSADLGEAHAQVDLAGYLLMGKVTGRDPVEARRLLELAAARNHANGLYLLAQVYHKGDGIDANPRKAEALYRRAHEAGRPDAAWQVALLLTRKGYRSEGGAIQLVATSLREAIEWARIAAEKDPDPAKRRQAAELVSNLNTLAERAERESAQSPSPGSGVK